MAEVNSIAILDDAGAPLQTCTAKSCFHSQKLFTDILGLRIKRLRVRVELASNADAPDKISVFGVVRDIGNKTSVEPRLNFRATAKIVRQNPPQYETNVPLTKLNTRLTKDNKLEFCTIVREHGTSGELFSKQLAGWHNRGTATQPDRGKPDVTGDVTRQQPDALSLFLAGGVETIEVYAAEDDGTPLGSSKIKSWAFIRSPANVVFYSGHGGWWNGHLLRGTPFGHEYTDWLTPEQLLVEWQASRDGLIGGEDIDLLVINGCSVLLWNRDNSTSRDSVTRESHGTMWAQLLKKNQGPLSAIVGYRNTAPIDQPWGNRMAERYAARIRKQSSPDTYARQWMEVNLSNQGTWTAAAWDNSGYYYINYPGLDSYLSDKKPGEIIGPIPYP